MCVICAGGGGGGGFSAPRKKKEQILNCEFTKEQAEDWKVKLLCVSNNNLFENVNLTPPQLRGYLGVLNSIVVYDNNPCPYTATLEKIRDFMIYLIGLELCQ